MTDTKVAEKHFCKDCKHVKMNFGYVGMYGSWPAINICRPTYKTEINYGDENKNQVTYEECNVKNKDGTCQDFKPKPPEPIKTSWWRKLFSRSKAPTGQYNSK